MKKAIRAGLALKPEAVAEACAMLLLNKASEVGSRTATGRVLCDLAERIRNGEWKAEQ